MKEEGDYEKIEISKYAIDEIARQVKEGFIKGNLEHKGGISFDWELKINGWKKKPQARR